MVDKPAFLPGERTVGTAVTFDGRSALARQRIDDAYSILFESGRLPGPKELKKARFLLDEADKELERLDQMLS